MENGEEDYGLKTMVFASGEVKTSPQRISRPSQDLVDRSDAKPGVPRKPLTGYFIFMNEQRKEANLSHKEISTIWNSLSATDKQVYIQKAADMKVEYDRYMAEQAQRQDENGEAGLDQDRDEAHGQDADMEQIETEQSSSDLMNSLLPFSRIKNLLKLDKECADGIRTEAVKYIQEAAYNFARELIAQSINQARKQKKKKLTADHILKAADVHLNKYFIDRC